MSQRRKQGWMTLTWAALLCVAAGVATTVGAAPARAAGPYVVNKTTDAADRNIGDGICDSSKKTGNQCTLRAAIQEANFNGSFDTINFDITTTPRVIKPASPLPPITAVVMIDGYSQPGSSINTLAVGNNAVLKITLDGVNAGAGANGLEVGGYKSTIRGLVIQRFGGVGIVLVGQGDKVFGNFIGTNAAGTVARPNGTGILLTFTGGNVGSSNRGDRNLISGNTGKGIWANGPDADSAFITNNYIGTTKNGTAALGNGGEGVRIEGENAQVGYASAGYGNLISGNGGAGVFIFEEDGINGSKIVGNLIGTDATGTAKLGNDTGVVVQANGVTVGGLTTAARNVISGNDTIGVLIYHLVEGNFVQGNYIGTNAAGTGAVGNGSEGVLTQDSSETTIGGDTVAARNVISGNASHGVDLVGGDHNAVRANRIGTKADGTGDLGNGGDGILIVGSTQNVIGGTGAQGNTIANNDANGLELNIGASDNDVRGNGIVANALAGVRINGDDNGFLGNAVVANGTDGFLVDSTATGNRISANQALSNGGLAIDLAGGAENSFGVTSNDTDDPDTGANGLQNFPTLTVAARSTTTGLTSVAGSLNSTPSTTFRIEIFLVVVDASGHGEAQAFLSGFDVTTGSGGDVSFSKNLSGLGPSLQLSATATSAATNETSEMSTNTTIVAVP